MDFISVCPICKNDGRKAIYLINHTKPNDIPPNRSLRLLGGMSLGFCLAIYAGFLKVQMDYGFSLAHSMAMPVVLGPTWEETIKFSSASH